MHNRNYGGFDYVKIYSELLTLVHNPKNIEIATCKAKGWTPTITWARKKGNNSWVLIFKTELKL